ncbi:hypothetical protein K523DRAFT_53409 [Schizophyllum commune Tattone D]|nr:hypothetical protein K523DRAFT_53409 [Schizophyllum commune Tattone D]
MFADSASPSHYFAFCGPHSFDTAIPFFLLFFFPWTRTHFAFSARTSPPCGHGLLSFSDLDHVLVRVRFAC